MCMNKLSVCFFSFALFRLYNSLEAPVTINVYAQGAFILHVMQEYYLVSTKFVRRTLTSGASLQAPRLDLS